MSINATEAAVSQDQIEEPAVSVHHDISVILNESFASVQSQMDDDNYLNL